jgi:hypothetical protein
MVLVKDLMLVDGQKGNESVTYITAGNRLYDLQDKEDCITLSRLMVPGSVAFNGRGVFNEYACQIESYGELITTCTFSDDLSKYSGLYIKNKESYLRELAERVSRLCLIGLGKSSAIPQEARWASKYEHQGFPEGVTYYVVDINSVPLMIGWKNNFFVSVVVYDDYTWIQDKDYPGGTVSQLRLDLHNKFSEFKSAHYCETLFYGCSGIDNFIDVQNLPPECNSLEVPINHKSWVFNEKRLPSEVLKDLNKLAKRVIEFNESAREVHHASKQKSKSKVFSVMINKHLLSVEFGETWVSNVRVDGQSVDAFNSFDGMGRITALLGDINIISPSCGNAYIFGIKPFTIQLSDSKDSLTEVTTGLSLTVFMPVNPLTDNSSLGWYFHELKLDTVEEDLKKLQLRFAAFFDNILLKLLKVKKVTEDSSLVDYVIGGCLYSFKFDSEGNMVYIKSRFKYHKINFELSRRLIGFKTEMSEGMSGVFSSGCISFFCKGYSHSFVFDGEITHPDFHITKIDATIIELNKRIDLVRNAFPSVEFR